MEELYQSYYTNGVLHNDANLTVAYTVDGKGNVNYIYVVDEGWQYTLDLTLSDALYNAGWRFANGTKTMTINDSSATQLALNIVNTNKNLGIHDDAKYDGAAGVTANWSVDFTSGTLTSDATVTVKNGYTLTLNFNLPSAVVGRDRDMDVEIDGLKMSFTLTEKVSGRDDATATSDVINGTCVLGDKVYVTVTSTDNTLNGATVATIAESNNYQTC